MCQGICIPEDTVVSKTDIVPALRNFSLATLRSFTNLIILFNCGKNNNKHLV